LADGFPSLELERVAQPNGLRPDANRAVVVFTRKQRALCYVRARLWAKRVERFVARASVVIGEASGNGVGEDGGSKRRQRGARHGIIFMPVPKAQNRAFGEFAFGADVEAVLIFPLQRDAVLHGLAAHKTVDDGIGAVR
jgi:hypothetical protein